MKLGVSRIGLAVSGVGMAGAVGVEWEMLGVERVILGVAVAKVLF